MQHDRNKVLIFRGIAVLISIASITLSFVGSDSLISLINKLCFFTQQSNIFLCVILIILFVKTVRDRIKFGRYGEICSIKHRWVHFLAIAYITMTFVVFAIILAVPVLINTLGKEGAVMSILISLGLHYIVPVMAIIDWVKFAPHGNLNKKMPLYALCYFPVYMTMLVIRATSGVPMVDYGTYVSMYPYPFLDIDALGWWSIIALPLCAVLLSLLAYGYVKLDNRLAKRNALDTEETTDEENQLQ